MPEALSYAQREHLRQNGGVPPELLRDFYGPHSPTESHGRHRGNIERRGAFVVNLELPPNSSGDLLPSQPLLLTPMTPIMRAESSATTRL